MITDKIDQLWRGQKREVMQAIEHRQHKGLNTRGRTFTPADHAGEKRQMKQFKRTAGAALSSAHDQTTIVPPAARSMSPPRAKKPPETQKCASAADIAASGSHEFYCPFRTKIRLTQDKWTVLLCQLQCQYY